MHQARIFWKNRAQILFKSIRYFWVGLTGAFDAGKGKETRHDGLLLLLLPPSHLLKFPGILPEAGDLQSGMLHKDMVKTIWIIQIGIHCASSQ